MQIGKEWSQHGADKGFVVFWRAGEYHGLHKHTCTDQLRKRQHIWPVATVPKAAHSIRPTDSMLGSPRKVKGPLPLSHC